MRLLTFKDAIREAQEEVLKDSSVVLIGEGVPDPKRIFGTTAGLKEKFPNQVFDMPVSENGMTGVCVGVAVNGLKPILVHQRMDFSLYSMDQIVNNAAKWYSMFGGNGGSCPLVIRMIIGRGWGAGNQHSQNLTALLAHIPGLKIMFPTNARDAYSLFIEAVKDPNPVIFIEHRWLYETVSNMDHQQIDYDPDCEISVLAIGHAALEARKAREALKQFGIRIRVIEIQKIKPVFLGDITNKSNQFIIVEDAWEYGGLAGEIGMRLYEQGAKRVQRITCPDYPAASSPALTKDYYPTAGQIVHMVGKMLNKNTPNIVKLLPHDVPDATFRGPF